MNPVCERCKRPTSRFGLDMKRAGWKARFICLDCALPPEFLNRKMCGEPGCSQVRQTFVGLALCADHLRAKFPSVRTDSLFHCWLMNRYGCSPSALELECASVRSKVMDEYAKFLTIQGVEDDGGIESQRQLTGDRGPRVGDFEAPRPAVWAGLLVAAAVVWLTACLLAPYHR